MTEEKLTSPEAVQDSVAPMEKKVRRSKWHWLWRGVLFLLLLISLPMTLLTTSWGQRSVVELVDKFLNELKIERIDGTLQEGLTLSNAQFKIDGVDVTVGKADLHIGFRCLLDRRACIENMTLQDTVVTIDTAKLPASQTPSQTDQARDFELPIGVALNHLIIDNLTMKVDEMDIQLDHFQSGIRGEGKNIALLPTTLSGLRLSLAPQAVENRLDSAKKVEQHKTPIDWQALKQQLSQPLLNPQMPIRLPLNVEIPDFQAKTVQITQKVKNAQGEWETPMTFVNVSSLTLSGQSTAEAVTLNQLDLQSDKGNVSGQGAIVLNEKYPLTFDAVADTPFISDYQLPESRANLHLSGELFGQTVLSLKTSGAVKAEIVGNVQLSEPKTPFSLQLKSDQIRYPFIDEKGREPFKVDNINLLLNGNVLNYQLNIQLDAEGMGIPRGQLALKGEGTLTYFVLNELTINALQGITQLKGSIDWTQGVEWQTDLQLANVNTKSLTPAWEAVLSGVLTSNGYVGRGESGEQWSATVSDLDLNGKLFQKNLQLKGNLVADAQQLLNVQGLNLIYGVNRINLKGIIGEKSDFNADINAPNLEGLIPKLKASLQGRVKLLGKMDAPHLDLDLIANNVAYDQFKLQHLTAKGNINTEQEMKGNIALNLRRFQYDTVNIEQANVDFQGSETNHQLKLIAKGEPVGANLHISGNFDRSQQMWQGQVSNVLVQSPVGEWKNDKALGVVYRNKLMQADITAHCWRNPKLNICFPKAFSAGKSGTVPFDMTQLDLTMIQPFLPKESQLSGIVSAKGEASWAENKAPNVNVTLQSNGLTFAQKIDSRTTFPITFSPLKMTAKMAENNLTLNTDIKIENNGRIVSELVMKDIVNKRALSGNVQLEKLNLSLVKPLLNKGEKIDGDINARLTLGGTAFSPLLFGNLNLTGLKVNSNAMPFDIVGGGMAMNFNGATSTLKGNVQTKESNLLLEGDANWQKLEAWHTRVKAQANRFRVDIPKMAKVDISPNIEVKATPNALILGGNIDIPWARIAVEELPESAVAVSSDEVIMDTLAKNTPNMKAVFDQKNQPQTGAGMAIKADIAINVGNDVKIDAYGLKSELNGTVKVRQGNKGLGLYGQINLRNGTFASFGQDLVIRKGLISFTGTPSQPTLDIEAIRNPEAIEDSNVTAGVKVTGIADAPEVKLFSTPQMPQDEILSYILTGRGLESSGDSSSSNSIAAALIGLSLSKSSKMVGGVGSAFGISDLSVSTAGIGDNTKVVVSGNFTPKFKVKYGVGIFAPLTELTLRYRLAPSLYLQWVSSINQAVDLLYQFEF